MFILLQPVQPFNWLQLDKENQRIYGIAVHPYYNQSPNETYLLRATDSDDLYADAVLMVTINNDNLLKVSHLFTMSITTDFTLFSLEQQHIVWWVGNITKYFNSATDELAVINVTGPMVNIAWTNTTIISPYTCPYDAINSLFESMSSRDPSLTESLPQFLITSLSLELVGICEGFIVTTSTKSTSTASPAPETTTPTNQTSISITEMGSTRLSVTASIVAVEVIIVPLVILLLIIIIIIILIVCMRKRNKYKGKSHFDAEYRPRSPIIDMNDESGEGEPAGGEELYRSDEFINETFFLGPSPQLRRDPPPRYVVPPPFPAKDTQEFDPTNEIGPL